MKRIRIISTSVFALAAFLFFALGYKYHLLECESSKIFLFTWDYFRETVFCRGGLCNYISAFLIQFYHIPVVGAAIIALALGALQWGLSVVCRNGWVFPFTFVPSGIYWALLCNNNYTLNGLISLVLAVYCAVLIMKIKFCDLRIVLFLLVPLTFYYIFGGRFFMYADAPVWVFVLVWGVTAAVFALGASLPSKELKAWWSIVLVAAVFFAAGAAIFKNYNALDEEIFKYTYLARNCKWAEIEQCALKKQPASPVSTNALNLSIARKGEMGERLFTFFQKGKRSLINFEEREMSAEILFHLGFINEAQHITFEAMASNPDLQRGAFQLLRLAQMNMIASRREVAHKYYKTLSHTLFYRSNALKMLAMSEEQISSHPLYGELRRMQPVSPFRFDAADFEGMLEIMVQQHPDNRLAGEYLNASYLLGKDLKAFEQRLEGMHKPLAKHYEEAAVMISALKGGPASSVGLQNYINAYNNCGGNPAKLQKYSGTYWFYYNFR